MARGGGDARLLLAMEKIGKPSNEAQTINGQHACVHYDLD